MPEYENEAVFQRNRLPPRSYFRHGNTISLNGSWNFHYSPSPVEAPPIADCWVKALHWDKIDLPGHWQLQGYGHPHYTNVQLPFPVDPPYIPSENPTGTYYTHFELFSSYMEGSEIRLRFLGVDSAFHVYMNGEEVGYHQGSRNVAEFDVTRMVRQEKPQEILVRVYQWSDGSYIEDQDQWWLSGVFRDVEVLVLPAEGYIEDCTVSTKFDLDNPKNATLYFSLNLHISQRLRLHIKLYDQDGKLVRSIYDDVVSIKLTKDQGELQSHTTIADPIKWTAESPYLYTFQMKLLHEGAIIQDISQRVGFRQVNIINGNLCVNSKPILLKGVNRHDSHPRFGRAVPHDYIKQDLILMKQYNVNAIRTSHYPPDPYLLDLCDELGFWVINEADLECHGFFEAVSRTSNLDKSLNYFDRLGQLEPKAAAFTSDKDSWRGAYLDRMECLVQRDKNHPSVIMWSLGNESFYGKNHAAMYELGKKLDPTRPIHYEGDREAKTADVFSYMYPSIDYLVERATAQGDAFEKAIILCEYAHAMGNGPGALEEYQQAFRDHRRLQGGFIWEWANHGIWQEDLQRYAYGGDFGDEPNDGSFVMDGLCFSDHTPTPGLVELMKVFAPVRCSYKKGFLFVTNGYDFSNLDHLEATWEVSNCPSKAQTHADGTPPRCGLLRLPYIAAGSTVEVLLPSCTLHFPDDGSSSEKWLTVSFQIKAGFHEQWASPGHEVGFFQTRIQNPSITQNPVPSHSPTAQKLREPTPTIDQTQISITITATPSTFTFSRATGILTSWTHSSHRLLHPSHGPQLSVWRAPTDNDLGTDAALWTRYGLDQMSHNLRSITVSSPESSRGNSLTVTVVTAFAPPVLAWRFMVTTRYNISAAGVLAIDVQVKPYGDFSPTLPRLGLTCTLPKEFRNVVWFGKGPGESYVDSCTSQKVGVYQRTVDEMFTNYEVPQENGNRMETRWVTITDQEGKGVAVEMTQGEDQEKLFSFNASYYTAEDLEKAMHAGPQLKGYKREEVVLRMDEAHHGLGTGSCGPGVLEKYQLKVKEEGWSFGFEMRAVGFDDA